MRQILWGTVKWKEKVSIYGWLTNWVLVLIWHWVSIQIDYEWDWSTTNFNRSQMKLEKQNWFFVVDFMTWDFWITIIIKRCVYGLGFERKRPNPRPSPSNPASDNTQIIRCYLDFLQIETDSSPSLMTFSQCWFAFVPGLSLTNVLGIACTIMMHNLHPGCRNCVFRMFIQIFFRKSNAKSRLHHQVWSSQE